MPIACPICKTPARFMAKHPEADIYRCSCCTHAFSDLASMPDQELYDSAYYENEHRRWFDHPDTALFDGIVALIPEGGSVLDIGCGRGAFLHHVRSKRPDVQLTGVDYSLNQDEGISFFQGDALRLDLSSRFDVVVSLAVIEHVPDCVELAKRMRELTKPGGTVVVMTLDESSILFALARMGRALGVPVAFDRLYSRHHVHHFTRASLTRLLESCGLKVSQRIMHNAPFQAVDLPVRGRIPDALFRMALRVVFVAGSVLSKAYLQTVICFA